jgi:hypothetical protein
MKTFRKDKLDEKEDDKLDVEIKVMSENEKGKNDQLGKLSGCLQFQWIIETKDRMFFFAPHCPFGDLFN